MEATESAESDSYTTTTTTSTTNTTYDSDFEADGTVNDADVTKGSPRPVVSKDTKDISSIIASSIVEEDIPGVSEQIVASSLSIAEDSALHESTGKWISDEMCCFS